MPDRWLKVTVHGKCEHHASQGVPVEMKGEVIDVEEFYTVFAEGPVRPRLGWSAVRAACEVKEVFSRSRELLGGLHTVWYSGQDGRPREFSDEDARPIQVNEALSGCPPDREKRIVSLADQFRHGAQPVQLVLAGYSVGPDQVLLLDGNHRAAAGYLADVDIRLLLFVLHGPIDNAVLPDLRHFQRP